MASAKHIPATPVSQPEQSVSYKSRSSGVETRLTFFLRAARLSRPLCIDCLGVPAGEIRMALAKKTTIDASTPTRIEETAAMTGLSKIAQDNRNTVRTHARQ